jgi:hypothetical protein
MTNTLIFLGLGCETSKLACYYGDAKGSGLLTRI